MHRPLLLSTFMLALWAAGALGSGFDFYDSGPYHPEAPRPEEFLGYPLGTHLTHHFRIEDYFEALAAALPDRVRLTTYGESYEKKRLFLALIASPGNLSSLDSIRRRNLDLADPRRTSASEASTIVREAPIVVWLDYGNDGNESAASEAAMQVAYQLAASDSEEARLLRQQAVTVIGPDHNPESHDRHVAWYNAFGVGDSDPLAMEHHAPWGMSTNNNHYQIDLNRDAWPLSQRENQAIAAAILRWRPQVFVDHHGQTENYFFAPPALPINPSLPESHRRWYEVIGRGNAAAFDRHGWQFYVRDVFDLYYPGYWDSWPALHGAISMTYETDGGGSRGLSWRKQDGSIVTLRDGIAKHFTASLATVRTSVRHRQELLRDFWAFFATAMEAGERGSPARAFVFGAEHDRRRSAVLAGTLMRHGVEVRRLKEPFSAEARCLGESHAASVRFADGSYLVDMAQPDQRVAETFLLPDPAMDPRFIEKQYAIWSRNARRGEDAPRERDEFYDITSWSLPIAFGVEACALSEMPGVESEAIMAEAEKLAGSGRWDEEIPFPIDVGGGITARISSLDGGAEPVGEVATPARSVYVFRPQAEGALRLVAGLLREDYRVAVSTQPLVVGREEFPRGSFVVRVGRNPASLHQRLGELAREAGVEVTASDTAFAAHGQTGPGANAVRGLSKPRIAMIADEGVRITEYGAAWFHLENRLGFPFTPIRLDELMEADVDDFDVVVFPQGRSKAFARALGERGADSLKSWVERGGTLVAWGSETASWLIDIGLIDSGFVGGRDDDEERSTHSEEATLSEIDRLTSDSEARPPVSSPSADPAAPQPIPGAVVRTDLDLTHWLTIGFVDSTLPVLVQGSRFLDLSEAGDNPVVFSSADRLHVGGFLWPDNSHRWLAGSAYTVVTPQGRGQVVLFAQDPNFRLVWRSTSRLFSNALLLGPTLGTESRSRF